MAEYVPVNPGNMSESLAPGTEFTHPGITLDSRALRLAEVTGNAHEIYRNTNFARALGHPEKPISPLSVLYIAFCQGVEDLSLNSDAFRGIFRVSVGDNSYDGDTVAPTTTVYGRKPRTPGDKGVSIVGFLSDVSHEVNYFGGLEEKFMQWYRVNDVNNGVEEEVPYREREDPDPQKPPENMLALPPKGIEVIRNPNPEHLKRVVEYCEKRGYMFADDLRPETGFEFKRRKTITDSSHVDETYGWRNLAGVHFDQQLVEEGDKYSQNRIVFGLYGLLNVTGIAASNRYGTTIFEPLEMDNVRFWFPVLAGTTINDVRAEVVEVLEDHPANIGYAVPVKYKVTARGRLPIGIREAHAAGELEGQLAGLISRAADRNPDPLNPVVLQYETTVLQLRRPKS